jgi:hypothetical protein
MQLIHGLLFERVFAKWHSDALGWLIFNCRDGWVLFPSGWDSQWWNEPTPENLIHLEAQEGMLHARRLEGGS